jgi:hypothetical protein
MGPFYFGWKTGSRHSCIKPSGDEDIFPITGCELDFFAYEAPQTPCQCFDSTDQSKAFVW